MTNINCTSNCIYQKDGKCNYDIVDIGNFSFASDCAYFVASKNN